jgi:hypothetical protein
MFVFECSCVYVCACVCVCMCVHVCVSVCVCVCERTSLSFPYFKMQYEYHSTGEMYFITSYSQYRLDNLKSNCIAHINIRPTK